MWWRPTTRNASRLDSAHRSSGTLPVLPFHPHPEPSSLLDQAKAKGVSPDKNPVDAKLQDILDKVIMTHLWTPKYMRENIPNICPICKKKKLNSMQSFPVPVPHSSCQSFTVVVMLSEHIQWARLHQASKRRRVVDIEWQGGETGIIMALSYMKPKNNKC